MLHMPLLITLAVELRPCHVHRPAIFSPMIFITPLISLRRRHFFFVDVYAIISRRHATTLR